MATHNTNTSPEGSRIERGEAMTFNVDALPDGLLDILRSCNDRIPGDWRSRSVEMKKQQAMAIMGASYDGASDLHSEWYDIAQNIIAAEAGHALALQLDNVIPIGRASVAGEVQLGNVAG